MIRFDRVGKAFGAHLVLSALSFDLDRGSHLTLLGPSGSGKTTVLRILAGLEEADEGSVWIDGRIASEPRVIVPPHQRSIGFAFQSTALWPHMTVAGNLEFASHGAPSPARSRREVTEALSLGPLLRKMPHELSGGEARRVAVARALVGQPARILLDEPLAHIDQQSRAGVLDFVMARARATDATVILVTHDASDAARIGGATLRLPKPEPERDREALRLEAERNRGAPT
jgi:iron(III) transport system ATP-binding protein